MEDSQFKLKVLETLTNLTQALTELHVKIIQLAKANSEAFEQTKICVIALAKNQQEVNEDLSDAMGTIRGTTW